MIFLSRLILNPRTRRVQHEITNLYELHRTIMQAYPADQERKKAAVLFRVEQHNGLYSSNPKVLVQSTAKPDWRFLEAEKNYLFEPKILVKEYTPNITNNDVFRFTLRANPTRRIKETRKLIGIVKELELIEWIRTKGDQYGFSMDFDSLVIRKIPPYTMYKKQENEVIKISLLATDFSGYLQVVDREKFLIGVVEGIGRGRSFGCGLLSLARI